VIFRNGSVASPMLLFVFLSLHDFCLCLLPSFFGRFFFGLGSLAKGSVRILRLYFLGLKLIATRRAIFPLPRFLVGLWLPEMPIL